MKRHRTHIRRKSIHRRGSTLVIVIAMLGLLAFTGTVFYLFAAQERSAAEFFAGSAKIIEHVPDDDPIAFGLQQVLIGPKRSQNYSILSAPSPPTRKGPVGRHSIVRNQVGSDNTPHTGRGVRAVYSAAVGGPIADGNFDGVADGTGTGNLINFVDSIAAWGSEIDESTLREARAPGMVPEPDVDYTSPDINNLFLAWKGMAIRDNGAGAAHRFQQVPVIIPSFFRPQYLKSTINQGPAGADVPTDPDWYLPGNVVHGGYQFRSFRPHLKHIGGVNHATGIPVFRFLESERDLGILPVAGAFPFRRHKNGNSEDFGRLGIWTGDAPTDPNDPPKFELDSDNDGDGIKEGIWMDLQYPIQETLDGRFYATLHSFTIYDLDGLINLNAHGNLAGLPRDGTLLALIGEAGLGSNPASVSNQGLGPNEVNPLYTLLPNAPTTDSQTFGTSVSSSLEQANMEWISLLTGRISDEMDPPLEEGRWGDPNALLFSVGDVTRPVRMLPRPGRAGNLTQPGSTPNFGGNQGFDDNADSFEGVASFVTGRIRGFVHPLDFSGTGTNRNSPDFRLPNLLQDVGTGPKSWLRYLGYSALGSATLTLNDSLYMRGRDGQFGTDDDLSKLHFYDALFEDPLEMIIDLDLTLRPDDQMFSVQDLLIGHLTKIDFSSAQVQGSERLQRLLPDTFRDNPRVDEIDRSDRFTTIGHTLRQIPFLQQQHGDAREWELTADSDGDGRYEFPPAFGNGAILPNSATDPFRPEVRRLLTIEAGEQRQSLGQLPLSVNHILDVNRSALTPPEGTSQYLSWILQHGMRFRPLTEHPAGSEVIGGSTAAETVASLPLMASAFPPQTISAREFWARRDRQKLARDIYVLLYTLGGAQVTGESVVNYTANNDYSIDGGTERALYSSNRLRQMAQFAVNLIDAMDTDNVVTMFEYDKNLGNGWNLDDNASTYDGFVPPVPPDPESDGGMYPFDVGDRGVVFGVEAQQLAFSEVLAVHSPQFIDPSAMDDPATEHDDTSGDHYFLHVELQNILPMMLELATLATGIGNENYGLWRLARFDRAGAAEVDQVKMPNQTLTLMNGNPNLAGGDRFTINMAALDGAPAVANPTGFGSADLYIDVPPGDMEFDLISPDVTAPAVAQGTTADPNANLDIIHANHDNRWLLTGSNDTDRGLFLDGMQPYNGNFHYGITPTAGALGARNGFDLVLQRRLNPNLPHLPLMDNPWIEVDRIKAEFIELFADPNVETPMLDLSLIKSLERKEVLDGTQFSTAPYDDASDPEANPLRRNTIGSHLNSRTIRFDLWQAHFDRDFASPGELLNLPIIGPRLLTRALDRMRFAGYRQGFDNHRADGPPVTPDNIVGAAGMFLQPEFPIGDSTVNDRFYRFDNRWYRLFQFVEVPSRVNRMLGNYLNRERLPGKINVNTMRHREVYAGLVDDPLIADVVPLAISGSGTGAGPFLVSNPLDGPNDTPGFVTRDRWQEFINERDGYVPSYDAIYGPVNVWLPGTPNSRPFRSLAYTTGFTRAEITDNGMDETLLRRLSNDLQPGEVLNPFNRHWLEPGDRVFHDNPGASAVAPPVSDTANMVHRHQFLSKIMNNTTTVSNCFIVYVTAAYFEAVPDAGGSGVFRVGGRMGLDLDGDEIESNDAGWERRAVVVIDRTELFNAYDPVNETIEWERLVKARLDLASDGQ